ncbi:MAG: PD-(D/E)XK nuclease family protein, partial [Actinomycetota bacterium]|nr:PD-(D/E)XK nuclease family protein [Actinomycetota bacterium]
RFHAARLLDVEELPGSADDGAAADSELQLLRERFLAGEWADRHPVDGGVEVPFEMSIEGVLVRGRMDAVFAAEDGSWDVVDWKTGHVPVGREAQAGAVQLAAYRLAWHRLTGAPLDRIRAGFHYVRTGTTLRPADLLDEVGLRKLIAAVPLAE